MNYLLLITDRIFCVFEGSLPAEYMEYAGDVKSFSNLDKAKSHINRTCKYDDIWLFGIYDVNRIKPGCIYYKS